MKYYKANFTLSCPAELLPTACDLVAALAGEAGFETFENTGGGLVGYVQQALFDPAELDEQLAAFPMPGVTVGYEVEEAEDRDWNEQWEQEGFEPIVVADGRIVVHDGRHLPKQAPTADGVAIEIDAKLAFGTGTHETTRMILATLLDLNLSGLQALDAGCGTGILAIAAAKLGASHCTAYDIDEWSVDNTRHNAVINQVADRITPLHGDASVLAASPSAAYQLVTANINRNILLADMGSFHRVMAVGGSLVLSGFYQADIPLLRQKAESLGMSLAKTLTDGDWACLVFRKSAE